MITGQVCSDGVGDYYHMIHTAEQIKKFYPTINIEIIPQFQVDTIPANLRILDSNQFTTVFCMSNSINPEAKAKISAADLMLEVSRRGHFDGNTNYQYIEEYGYNNERSMGVNDIELGIAIKEKPASSSLNNITNEPLKQLFFNTSQPTLEDLKQYLESHELFSAYLKMGSCHQLALIYTIVALAEKSNKQTVDICLPDVDMHIFDIKALIKHGMGKLTTCKCVNGQLVKKEVELANEGKELRLINPFPLSQDDFYALMFNGNSLSGCTGDNSLSEVLSFDLIPFYEIIGQKGGFWSEMILLAGNVGGPDHNLQHYFQELDDIIFLNAMKTANTLKEFYVNLPKAKAFILDLLKTLNTVHNELNALAESSDQLSMAKKLIQSLELVAEQYSQDPVKAYLEDSTQSNINALKKTYDDLLENLDRLNNNNAKALSVILKKANMGLLIYAFKMPQEAQIDKYKEIQPELIKAAERIAVLLENPALHQEALEFSHLLKTQYNYNLALKDLVGRKLTFPTYPELESYEKELFDKFDKGEVDALQANHLLKAKIDNLTHSV